MAHQPNPDDPNQAPLHLPPDQQGRKPSAVPDDLSDPEHDQERLQGEVTSIELPDVRDIPGQEHIHPPSLGMLADTTVSSDDEEGLINDGSGSLDDEPDDL